MSMSNPSKEEPDYTPTLGIRPDGRLLFDSIIVGNVEGDRVTLNLGWMAAAGLHVTLEADPKIDRVRGGIVLDR